MMLREIRPVETHGCVRETATGQIVYRFTARLPDGEMVEIVVPHEPIMSKVEKIIDRR